MDIQKMIDEEFRKKLEKEFTELTGTQFECIDNNGELFIADAKELNTGTLIIVEDSKMFRNGSKRDQNHMINAMLDTGCVILLISLLVRFVES